MNNRIRLTTDLDALLPGEDFTIGNQTIVIKPLSIFQIKLIVSRVNSLIKTCTDHGITGENYSESDKFVLLAEIIIDKFPDVLEELSNIASEDLQKLPLEVIVALLEKCLDVNLKSKDSLMGNFRSLAQKVNQIGILDKK